MEFAFFKADLRQRKQETVFYSFSYKRRSRKKSWICSKQEIKAFFLIKAGYYLFYIFWFFLAFAGFLKMEAMEFPFSTLA